MRNRLLVGVGLYVVAAVGFVVVGAWVTWPLAVACPPNDIGKLGMLINYVYTLTTVLIFFVVLGAGVFAMIQALDVAKSRKLAAISALYSEYKTDTMRDAIRAVWTLPVTDLRSDDGDKMRRLVSDYWHWVGWIVRERLVDTGLIFSRFPDNIKIWEKLEPVEIEIRRAIEKRFHPDASEAEIEKLTKEHVENLPAAYLYRLWKERPSCPGR